jgi:drug/metabolite transporter (DMT)-like permease
VEDVGMSRRGWILFAAMCVIWGIPYLLIKVAVEELAPATLVLARTGLAALILLPIAFGQGQLQGLRSAWLPLSGVAAAPRSWPSGRVLLAVLTLAVICTALAFLVFFQLIAEVGPARATVISYVNPAVAVLLGVLVLDERFTVVTAVGFVLVLAGSVLATSRTAVTEAAEHSRPSGVGAPAARP